MEKTKAFPNLQKFPIKKTSYSAMRSDSVSRSWRRGYTFGIGKRSEVCNSNGRNSPPPGTYNISSIFDRSPVGPMLRGQINGESSYRRMANLPGPGSYDPYLPLGESAPKYSLKSRLHMQVRSKSPGPSNYYPNFRTTQTSKFSGISFGIGSTGKKVKPLKNNKPGPGSYDIPSIFNNTFVNFPIP